MSSLIDQYNKIAGPEAIDQLLQLASPLKNIKITHVSSTLKGGGVAEILTKMVPLTNSLGISTSWEVIQGSAAFFNCTKKFHNALQGAPTIISASELKVYEQINEKNAEILRPILENSDIVIIHDPQPMAMISHYPNRKGKWIWRCHIDASAPDLHVWNYLSQFAEMYDASIFSLEEFTHPLPHPMFIIPPSIDPLSQKNVPMEQEEIDQILRSYGIDIDLPLIVQISRFDRFKDPLGVIQAFRMAHEYNPCLQLVLAGGGASDDPEGEVVLQEVKVAAKDNPNIHILLLPESDRTINALQRAAAIVVQKSIREGFGLTVTEALWKGKPVIGGNTGGIKLQVINKQTGFVVNTPEGASYRMRYLLQHPHEGVDLGKRGKEYVREKFLITRHLRDYLSLVYAVIYKKFERIEL